MDGSPSVSDRQEARELVSLFGRPPVVTVARLPQFPLHASDTAHLFEPAQLPAFRPFVRYAVIEELLLAVLAGPDGDGDADGRGDPEDVVGRPAELRVLADVDPEVQVVDVREVFPKVLPHPVERDVLDETVVGHEADDPILPTQAVHRPSPELDVGVIELVLEPSRRVLRVGMPDPPVDDRVLAILVVVVLVDLSHIVRRVADDDLDL